MSATSQRSSRHRMLAWLSWSLTAVFYSFEFLLQVSPDVMADLLIRDFSIDGTRLGLLGAIYFSIYALLQIPVGLILDWHGPRRTLSLAAFLCGLGSFGFGMAVTYPQALAARVLMGAGSAFAAVGCMKVAALWFPVNRFATLVGLSVTMGMLGAVFGHQPLAWLIQLSGWRMTFFMLAAVSILLAAAMFCFVRDGTLHRHMLPLRETIGVIVRARQSWLLAAYAGLMYTPTLVLGGLWGTPFLMSQYHLERGRAAGIVSCLFLGWLMGSPFFGMLSDYLGRRKPPLYMGALGALISCVALLYAVLPFRMLAPSFALLGFFSSGFVPSFSLMKERYAARLGATSLGFMNSLNMMGPVLCQPLVGFCLDLAWDGQFLEGIPIYSVTAYRSAFLVLPISLLMALLLLPLIEESYCLQAVD